MWRRVTGSNLTGTFVLTRAVLLLVVGRGSVVDLISGAALGGSASGHACTASSTASSP
jgi:NAD(P)-dependent dehydrogenase (short-subunit alcohol dehydrogenase family)